MFGKNGVIQEGDLGWMFFLYLGSSMWATHYDEMQTDDDVWRRIMDRCVEGGVNSILVDVGEGIVYPSHPELAVKGSWPKEKILAEVKRLKALGLEVIPKCNFSACHDAWLGDYSRMISTPEYYQVCADVIRDLCEAFDHPRYVHIGMEEETPPLQKKHPLMTMRTGDLWWHDFNFLVDEVEKNGAKTMCWTDWNLLRGDIPAFLKNMPKSVIQCPWYYHREIDPFTDVARRLCMKRWYAAHDLALLGYDVMQTGTTWIPPYYEREYGKDTDNDINFHQVVRLSKEQVPENQLKGLIMAPWTKTNRDREAFIMNALNLMIKEIELANGSKKTDGRKYDAGQIGW